MAARDLGLSIRRARERKRMTQQQLADAVGVSVRAVGGWERGEALPRNTLGALEAVLGDLGPATGDPQEERYRDLGRDRGGMLEPHEVDILIEDYRRRRAPETRAG